MRFNKSIVLAAAALSVATFSGGAAAAGCLSGAAVGGVAGHVAGHHALLGAAAGCAINHHRMSARNKAVNTAPVPPAAPAAPALPSKAS